MQGGGEGERIVCVCMLNSMMYCSSSSPSLGVLMYPLPSTLEQPTVLIYAMGRVSFNIVCVKLIIYKIVYKIFPQPNSVSSKSKVLANSSPPPSYNTSPLHLAWWRHSIATIQKVLIRLKLKLLCHGKIILHIWTTCRRNRSLHLLHLLRHGQFT